MRQTHDGYSCVRIVSSSLQGSRHMSADASGLTYASSTGRVESGKCVVL